jgi:hypothetical protein
MTFVTWEVRGILVPKNRQLEVIYKNTLVYKKLFLTLQKRYLNLKRPIRIYS